MSSVVQQRPSYIRLAQAYLVCGIIALSGIYPYQVQIASFSIDVFFAIAAHMGAALFVLKTFNQKDVTAGLLTLATLSLLIAPAVLSLWPPSLSIASFILLSSPLILVSQVDEGASDLIASVAELRREVRRVSWPSVQETLKFVAIVAIFVIAAALFWAFIDRIIQGVFSVLFYYLA